MKSVNKLQEISSKIDHLMNSAEWVAKETVHTDNAISQTGTLMAVLADEIREKIYALVQEMEKSVEVGKYSEHIH